MSDNFGLKIGLEGEKEFKKALSEINQTFKVLGSEMKAVSSQFDKNDSSVQALTTKNQVLNKEIDIQKQKIETLRSALLNAAESFGENDRRTQNWQIQLNNATTSLNELERELEQNNRVLDETEREMDDVADESKEMNEGIEDAGNSVERSSDKFKKFSSVLKGIGAAMGTVAVAAGTAAIALGKEVINVYADYEQLVGGVDTLFKESSQELQTYAANAYKTAGLSANDYMETVTSFSASLIQSLGGDTEKAVKYADMAITDMADNANKMGTEMSLIQNAYQGFAKQNYTMLDNLKLGYGGTKEEMQRLLADAQAISGIHYDISSYADIVDAIHVIQESMDIAGATAAEAENTISGSINSMQAALKNMLVGFGDANADMKLLCKNLGDAMRNVIRNVTPVITNMVKVLPTITDALINTFADLLPSLLEMVTNLFSQLLNTILTLLPRLTPAVVDAVMTIVKTLIDNLPLLIDAAAQLMVALVDGIGMSLPLLIPAAVEAIVTLVQGLIENLPLMLDAALQLMVGLADGLLAGIPLLIESLPSILMAIVDFIVASIPQIIEAGIRLLTSLVAALPEIIETIIVAIPQIIEGIIHAILEAIPQIVEAGVELLIALVQALPDIILIIVEAIPEIITGIIDALVNHIPQITETGILLFTSLIANLPTIIVEIVKAVPQIITAIVQAFTQSIPKIVAVGENIVRGLWQGIQQLTGWLWDKVHSWISSIWDGICNFFGIHSPSDEMAWVGQMLVKGLAGAIDTDGKQAVKSAEHLAKDINEVMHDLSIDMTSVLPKQIDVNTDVNYLSALNNTQTAQVFNVTIPLIIDGSILARVLAEIQWTQNAIYVRNLGTI